MWLSAQLGELDLLLLFNAVRKCFLVDIAIILWGPTWKPWVKPRHPSLAKLLGVNLILKQGNAFLQQGCCLFFPSNSLISVYKYVMLWTEKSGLFTREFSPRKLCRGNSCVNQILFLISCLHFMRNPSSCDCFPLHFSLPLLCTEAVKNQGAQETGKCLFGF